MALTLTGTGQGGVFTLRGRSFGGSFTTSTAPPPTIVTSGLVLNLDAGNVLSYPGTGTTWTDISGNGNNCALANGPAYNSNYGGGIVFDGSNDFGQITNNSSLNPSSITVSSFFNLSSVLAFGPIVFKQNNYASFYEQYCLGMQTDGKIIFVMTGADRVQKVIVSTLDYRNTIINAVGTCDTITDEMKLYVNGSLIASTSFTSTIDSSSQNVNIGGLVGPNQYVNGTIYTTQIYNRALSIVEVLQNYNAQKSRFGL